MSLSSEPLHLTSCKQDCEHKTAAELFIRPSWLRLDSVVTSLLDIDEEAEKFRAAMKADLRLVSLSGLPICWDKPAFAPYRDVRDVLNDLGNGCR